MNPDVIIIGGGAAGLMCALTAGRRGRQVVVLEKSRDIGKKILISGGGRCNFTNLEVTHRNYLSRNAHFCKSALARFQSRDFIEMVRRHGIPYYEKTLGQLFCERSARDIVDMLRRECHAAGVSIMTDCAVTAVERSGERFVVSSTGGNFTVESVVVASGGLTLPKIASDIGYRIAEKFGLEIVSPRPALVPLQFDESDRQLFAELSGVAFDAVVTCGDVSFREAVLFTHRGLSGPAILQISSYWQPGDDLMIDPFAGKNLKQTLLQSRAAGDKMELKNFIAPLLTKRFAGAYCAARNIPSGPLCQFGEAELCQIAETLTQWRLQPVGTLGYDKAEVTLGGISTDALSSKTMAARDVPGLYFVGEVVDVTGWLGGYNFQWAWSSGFAAGNFV